MLTTAIEAEVAQWIDEHEHSGMSVAIGRWSATAICPSDDHHGHRPGEGPPAAGPRSPEAGRSGALHLEDSAALLAEDPEHRGAVALAVPQGDQHGRLQRGPAVAGGPGVSGPLGLDYHRLLEGWQAEYHDWSKRSLQDKQYVYLWVDGVHFNIRLEEDRQCILVVMGATADGKKELIAIADGYRESEQSWTELLLDVKSRGLAIDPKLATGDGALGFWKALPKVFPTTRVQRCWVHKTANVLDKLPKGRSPRQSRRSTTSGWPPPARTAEQAFDLFLETYGAKYPKACECLAKDREELLAFYDFPAEHWKHLRTTNPIESVFATVRLRHRRTKGSGTRVGLPGDGPPTDAVRR